MHKLHILPKNYDQNQVSDHNPYSDKLVCLIYAKIVVMQYHFFPKKIK